MSPIWIISAAVLLLVYLGFKMNTARTKIAFFLIFLGALFLLFIFFVFSGRLDISSLGQALSSVKGYFLSVKGFTIKAFEATGQVIGRLKTGNLTS